MLVKEVFGDTPTLVIQVADGSFDAVADCEPRRQMFSAALRTTAQGCTTVVLVFQFEALQLRCVNSLSHPGFLPLLRHAQETGHINVLVGNEAAEECGTMRPPFHELDVAALLDAVDAVPQNSAELFLADAVVTAAECWDADALPSMFSDVVVEHADGFAPVGRGCLPRLRAFGAHELLEAHRDGLLGVLRVRGI